MKEQKSAPCADDHTLRIRTTRSTAHGVLRAPVPSRSFLASRKGGIKSVLRCAQFTSASRHCRDAGLQIFCYLSLWFAFTKLFHDLQTKDDLLEFLWGKYRTQKRVELLSIGCHFLQYGKQVLFVLLFHRTSTIVHSSAFVNGYGEGKGNSVSYKGYMQAFIDSIITPLAPYLDQYGPRTLGIILLFLFGRFGLRRLVRRMVRLIGSAPRIRKRDEEVIKKRERTLISIFAAVGNVFLYAIILLMALDMFGIDTTPILTGAGILGLAVGFGSQTLVKDFVSGVLILLENQYNIGDKVRIGAFEGKVSKITVRSTVLKDDEGKVYYLSNGSIANVINLSNAKEKPAEAPKPEEKK